MDYRLLFTQRALTDLAEIIDHIAWDDDQTASHFGGALLDHVDLLRRYLRMGSAIRQGSPVRKLVHSPFVVYYQFHEKKCLVEVLHFRHGARKPPRF